MSISLRLLLQSESKTTNLLFNFSFLFPFVSSGIGNLGQMEDHQMEEAMKNTAMKYFDFSIKTRD